MSSRIVARVAFNALVIASLAGIGWWGHRTGWKVPKFSALNGNGAEEKKDWCEAHSVPESICIECDESLLPRAKEHGWCKEHEVHECPLCHPEVAQLREPYRVTQEDLDRAKRALATPRPKNNEDDEDHKRRIQFASEAAMKKAGVDYDRARKDSISETIPVFGEIVNDPDRVAHLSTRAAGSVAKVYKHLGDQVGEGDVLALVEASEVGKAKDQFSQAVLQMDVKRKDRARLSDSSPMATIDEKNAAIRDADQRFRAARQALINLGLPRTSADFGIIAEASVRNIGELDLMNNLHFLGIPDEIQSTLNREMHSNNLLPLRSPGKGQIVSRDISVGEVVDPSRPVFEVVDTSRLWLVLEVRAEHAGALIPKRSKVRFWPEGHGKDPLAETIVRVNSQADPATRTIKARAELDNDGSLRAHTFGKGEIVIREEKDAIVVPSTAVHWEGDCHVVFVRDKDWTKEGSYKFFHTRTVRLGARNDKFTEIIAGVLPGEQVVTKGGEILRAELLKSKLGAGCCAHH
jgi:membrane fusion protein, heavy metal efflux system